MAYERGRNLANDDQFKANEPVNYTLKNNLKSHTWSLGGKWQIDDESSQSLENGAKLTFNFNATEVFLVLSGPPGSVISASLDGNQNPGGADLNTQSQLITNGPRLYNIVKSNELLKNTTLTLTFPAGITVNAFTFGG